MKRIYIVCICCIFYYICCVSLFGNIYSIKSVEKDVLMDSCSMLVKKTNLCLSTGDYEQALQLVKIIQQIREKTSPYSNLLYATNYENLGVLYYYNWQFDSALIMYQRAEKVYVDNPDIPKGYLGNLYSNTGLIYSVVGELVLAEQYYQKANNLLNYAYSEPFIQWKISLRLRFGSLLLNMKDPDNSIKYFQMALQEILKEKENVSNMIQYLLESSITYSHLNQFQTSIDLQKKAVNLCRKDSLKNITHLAKLYNNIALDFVELNDYKSADIYYQKALSIHQATRNSGIYCANVYLNIGAMNAKQKSYNRALNYYQKALKILVPDHTPANVLLNPDIQNIPANLPVLEIFKEKTKCLKQVYLQKNDLKYLDAAIQTSLLAVALIEELRSGYQTYESKTFLAENEDLTFKTALELTRLAYYKTHDEKYSRYAFRIAEKNRASILLASLHELNAKKFGGVPDSLLAIESLLARKIARYKENIYEEKQLTDPDSLKISTWENYLFQAQRLHDDLIQLFEKEYPKYYAFKYNNKVTNPQELQKILNPGVAIIEYSISDNVLYTFVITRKNFHFQAQNIDSSFLELISSLLYEYQQFDFSKQYYNTYAQFCGTSKQLFDILIKPIYSFISSKDLVIIPDGILSYLPFETLIRKLPDLKNKGSYKNPDYLLKHHNISYSYSSTLYKQSKENGQGRGVKKLLAFAPAYNTKSTVHVTAFNTRQQYRKNLQPIPGVLDEVAAIKALISSDVYSGDQATESKFKEIAANYDILHLAMHAVIDNNNPMFSKLIFSSEKDTLNDGFLNTHEIFGLQLNAKLVVLSACGTGEGDYTKGEGVVSLARGFAYAGVSSLMMTLWEVEDRSSVLLMKYFYMNLLRGQSKSQALRNAKLRFLKESKPENSHPFFWSAYVISGNDDPLCYNKVRIGIILSILILMTGGGLLLIRRRRIKHR